MALEVHLGSKESNPKTQNVIRKIAKDLINSKGGEVKVNLPFYIYASELDAGITSVLKEEYGMKCRVRIASRGGLRLAISSRGMRVIGPEASGKILAKTKAVQREELPKVPRVDLNSSDPLYLQRKRLEIERAIRNLPQNSHDYALGRQTIERIDVGIGKIKAEFAPQHRVQAAENEWTRPHKPARVKLTLANEGLNKEVLGRILHGLLSGEKNPKIRGLLQKDINDMKKLRRKKK